MTPRSAAPLLPLLIAVSACRSGPAEGTSVGNPGETRMSVARGTGLTLESASLTVVRTRWTDCVGVSTVIEEEPEADLIRPETLGSPPGSWCGLEVRTRGPLILAARSEDGFTLDLALALGTLSLPAGDPFFVDGDALALEIGSPGWLDAAALGAETGDVEIDAESEEHAPLVARATAEAALFEDDGDGEISDGERAAGAVAGAGAEPDDDDDDDDDDGA